MISNPVGTVAHRGNGSSLISGRASMILRSDNAMQSLKGQLLLDGGNLTGSTFHRTVVLICQHDPQGAFGLVLNHPSDHQLGEVLAHDLPEAWQKQALFLGGPVQPQALSCLLHGPSNDGLPGTPVLSGLQVLHNLDELLEVNEHSPDPTCMKFFAGYAGWGPGQLDNEMRMQAWLTYPASINWVFSSTPKNLWRQILRKKGPRFALLAESPEDPSVN